METQTLPSSTYRDVLKQAFKIAKNHRFLWFFGFFAAFFGVGGELEPLFRNYTNISETSKRVFDLNYFFRGGVIESVYSNVKLFFGLYPWQAFFFVLMILAIVLVIIWLAIVAQIALFDAAHKLSKNKEVRYHDGYRVGNRHFGTVFLINILTKVIVYGLFTVVAAPLMTWFLVQSNLWGGILFLFLIFFILIPISIIVSFMVKYAVAYVVIKDKQAGEAVRLGWGLFKKNWLISLEMAFLILAIGLGVGLAILLCIGIASVPFLLIGIAALFFGSQTGFAVAFALGTITWFVIAAIIGSAFVAFQYSAWTLLFLKLVEEKAQSKLLRWFGKLSLGRT